MKSFSKIPDATRCISLEASEGVTIDTKGLDCTVKAHGGDIFFKTAEKMPDSDAFLVKDGEQIDFCGKIYVFAKQAVTVYCLFYRTL